MALYENIGNYFESVGYPNYRETHGLDGLEFIGDKPNMSDLLSAKGTVYECKAHDISKAINYKEKHANCSQSNGGYWNKKNNPTKDLRTHIQQYIAKYDISILVVGFYADDELVKVLHKRGKKNIEEYLFGCASSKGANGIRYTVDTDTTKAGGKTARYSTLREYGWTIE